MDSFCENFTGGYCEKCGKHVPRSWCLNRCKGEPKNIAKTKVEPKIYEPPTLYEMAIHFSRAMLKWAKEGFVTVEQDEYIRRRQICSLCAVDRKTCPKCGCMLWAKVALVTETCEKWELENGNLTVEKQSISVGNPQG